MKKSFDSFMQDKHAEENDYLLDDELVEHLDEWLCELGPDDWMKYAEEYASIRNNELLNTINRAYDALREGQSTLATSILGQSLGYETPDYGKTKAQD